MAAFLIAWTLLLSICLPVGFLLLNLFPGRSFTRAGDRAMLAAWLGLLACMLSGFVLCLVVPLTPAAGCAVAAVFVTAGLASGRVRQEILRLPALLRWRHIIGGAGLSAGIAFYCSQSISHYDTGLYHFGAVQWLSRFGMVQGMGLVHSRLGFVSAWFSLPAFFNHGILEERFVAVGGGFVLLLAALQLCMCIMRRAEGRREATDLFLAVLLAASVAVPVFQKIPVSSSPDLPVILLTVLSVWCIVRIKHATETAGRQAGQTVLCEEALPFVLSLCCLLIKSSSAPLVAVCGLFYIVSGGVRKEKVMCAAAAGLVFAALTAFAATRVCGCPLYPLPLCFDVSWSVGADTAAADADYIRRWAGTVGRSITADQARSPLWPVYWALASRSTAAAAFLVLVSAGSAVVLWGKIRRGAAWLGWPIAIGAGGMLLIFCLAPDPRFGWAYFTVIPSLLFLRVPATAPGSAQRAGGRRMICSSYGTTACMLLVGAVMVLTAFRQTPTDIHMKKTVREGKITVPDPGRLHVLLPPRLPRWRPEWTNSYTVNDIDYRTPYHDVDQCWACDIPCAPGRLSGIRLRDPGRGLAAGFVREGP